MSEEALFEGFESPEEESSTGTSWLCRYDGQLYGPLATLALIDRIRIGQVPADATVARDGTEDFVAMLDVSELKDEVQKALDQWDLLQKKQQAARRGAARRNVILAALVLTLVGGGFFGTRWYAGEQQRQSMAAMAWRERQEEIRRLQAAPPPAPERAKLAAAEPDIDMDLIPLVSIKKRVKHTGQGSRVAQQNDEGPQGCQLDQAVLMSTFHTAFPRIKACVKGAGVSEMPEQIMLSFTIANEGTVAGFEMNEGAMKGTPFNDCMKQAVTSVRYPRFPGERCNIDYPISIGRKK